MKNIFILFIFMGLFTSSSFSQITITSSDMPGANDTLRYSIAFLDTLTLNTYQTADTNHLWDFSHLTPIGQDVTAYEAALQTSYAFFFLGGNKFGLQLIDTISFGQFTLTNIYDFYKNSSSKFEAEGRGITFNGIPVPSFYTDKDEIYQFPLDYGDSDSSTFDFTTNIAIIAAYQTVGTRVNTVDGWGTIVTPYDSVSCLRVVTDVVTVDSIKALGFSLGFPTRNRSYKWMANGEKIPMLEISGTATDSLFIPNELRYRDIYRLIQNSPLAPNANFFASNTTPNANADTVTLSSFNSPIGNSNTYQWSIVPNNFTYVNGSWGGSSNPEVVFTSPGTYDVSLTVSNQYGSNDTTKLGYIIVGTVGTNELMENNSLLLFPNPVTADEFYLDYELDKKSVVNVNLYHANGQFIRNLVKAEESNGKFHKAIPIHDLPQGFYFIKVQIGDTTQALKIFVK